MMRSTKARLAVGVGAAVIATAAYAATQVQLQFTQPQTLSQSGEAYKSKIVRLGNGNLISVYGDTATDAVGTVVNHTVYDVKSQSERYARDIYARMCPSLSKNCDDPANWSGPFNISKSGNLTSIQTDWQGTGSSPSDYYGDVGKPNIKAAGPAAVITWTSHYCPGGNQRAVKYLLRDNRVIPFSCTWASYSTDNGTTWSAAQQLSTGIRDAAQDSSRGTFDSVNTNTGNWVISWQEDPQGLQLGAADGPGDGASGALVTHGTDVWYTYASAYTKGGTMTWQTPVPSSYNYRGTTIPATNTAVYDSSGGQSFNVDSGQTGASRPNIGLVGQTTVLTWEETKGSEELDSGKYIRYSTFNFSSPPSGSAAAGCIISDPSKNARRVRFVYQSPTTNAMPLAIFWKEGAYDKGGPSDIVVRRGMGGVAAANLVPKVDTTNCETIVYSTAQALNNQPAENLSSYTPTATTANLSDDTEANWSESALAHRGLLRGENLWVGYSYTKDLGALQYAQTDNYNFWIRSYNVNTGWGNPKAVSNVTDTHVNVREPRLVGTQSSSLTGCPTDPTLCQNANVFYVAWGLQTNVSPWDPAGPEDLGLKITRTTDAGQTYEPVVNLSVAQGGTGNDSAFESQINVRPDGEMAFAVWNQTNPTTGATSTMYSSGVPVTVTVPDSPTGTTTTSSGGGGGCTLSPNGRPDPTLPILASLALLGLVGRRYWQQRK